MKSLKFRSIIYKPDNNNIRVSNSPKKDAIDRYSSRKTDWIVTTDADCIVNENWLLTIDNLFKRMMSQ
jgi:hypothetical protein